MNIVQRPMVKSISPLIIRLFSYTLRYFIFHSVPPNQLGDYPAWFILFFYHIILPMLGVIAIALKIILKNGKDLRRELFGVSFQPIASSIVATSIAVSIQPIENGIMPI